MGTVCLEPWAGSCWSSPCRSLSFLVESSRLFWALAATFKSRWSSRREGVREKQGGAITAGVGTSTVPAVLGMYARKDRRRFMFALCMPLLMVDVDDDICFGVSRSRMG